MTALSDQQLYTLMAGGPVLDSVSPMLPPALQARLLDIQQRAGDSYASGGWRVANTGETYFAPQPTVRPTDAEVRESLGQSYLALEENRKKLRELMDNMGLIPSFHQPSILDRVKGWLLG